MERIFAIARGKVQGVGYRQFVSECARRTGTFGEVKNMPDGTVHILVESSHAAIQEFLSEIRADGHPIIRVESLDVKQEPPTGRFKGFWVHW